MRRWLILAGIASTLVLAACSGSKFGHNAASVTENTTKTGIAQKDKEREIIKRAEGNFEKCAEAATALYAWSASVKTVAQRYTAASAWEPFIEKSLALEAALRQLPGTSAAVAAVGHEREAAAIVEADDVGDEGESLISVERTTEGMRDLFAVESAYPPAQIAEAVKEDCLHKSSGR